MAVKLWAGLDVGVETTSICVIDDNGEVLHEAVCPTNVKSVHREIAFLKRRRFAHVGMETGVGTALARGLRSLGYNVEIYEARQLSKFLRARRNKTDAGDASGIAHAGRIAASMVSRVYLKSLESQSLAARLTIRRHLIRSRVRSVNLLCRQIELFGGRVRTCRKASELRARVEAQIRELFGRTPGPLVAEIRYLLGHCEELITYQDELDQELKRLASENEVCRRLMQVPGVGPICALTFYATVGQPERFGRTADIGSYLGLTPRLHQSGLTYRMGRISKMGDTATRTLLVKASLQFMRRCRDEIEIRAWVERIEQRRGRGRARVALARKLAIIMLSIWKSGQDWQPRPVAA